MICLSLLILICVSHAHALEHAHDASHFRDRLPAGIVPKNHDTLDPPIHDPFSTVHDPSSGVHVSLPTTTLHAPPANSLHSKSLLQDEPMSILSSPNHGDVAHTPVSTASTSSSSKSILHDRDDSNASELAGDLMSPPSMKHENAVNQTSTDPVGQPMLVIGAALSRTGTLSTKLALEKLGHKVWHGSNLAQGRWPQLWGDLARAEKSGNASKAALDAIVKEWSDQGFTATLDMPAAVLYEDLLERYPDAKVLLILRDTEQWAKSAVSSVFRIPVLLRRRPFRWLKMVGEILELNGWILPQRMGVNSSDLHPHGNSDGAVMSIETTKAMYERYMARVKATVSPERLVEYSVKQGWQPLCDHIGFRHHNENQVCPLEEGIPFPRANSVSGGAASKAIQMLQLISWTWPFLFGIGVWFGLVGISVTLRTARMCSQLVISDRFKNVRSHLWLVTALAATISIGYIAVDTWIGYSIKQAASAEICFGGNLLPLNEIDAAHVGIEASAALFRDASAGGTPVLLKGTNTSWCSDHSHSEFRDRCLAEVHPASHDLPGLAPLESLFGKLLLTMHFSGLYEKGVSKDQTPPLHFDESPLFSSRLSFGLGISGPIGPTVLCECGHRRDVVVVTRSCSLDLFLSDDPAQKRYTEGVHTSDADIQKSDRWQVTLEPGMCLVFQPMLLYHQVSGYDSKSSGQSHRIANRVSKLNPLSLAKYIRGTLIQASLTMLLNFSPVNLPDGRSVLKKTK